MPEQQTPQIQENKSKELRLEEMFKPDSSEFRYVTTFTQQAIMDASPEMRAFAIRNLNDIGEHLPGQPKILGGYEKYRKLYLRIKTNEGNVQDIQVSEIPSKYETETSTQFTINGDNLK
jgi:hypothetical protein